MTLSFSPLLLLLTTILGHCSSSPLNAPADNTANVVVNVHSHINGVDIIGSNRSSSGEDVLVPGVPSSLSVAVAVSSINQSYILTGVLSPINVAVSAEADKACTSDSNEHACICNLKDGSGLIDLTPLVQQTANTPLRAAGLKLNYYLVFCGVITGAANQPNCNNMAAACEYSSTTGSNTDIGDPSTTRFEIWSNTQNPVPIPALVMDTLSSNKRTIAYLHCDPAQTENVKFISRGNQGTDPNDGYSLYNMDLTSAYFCPVPIAGLSAGSILLIIFFSLLFAYLVGGVLVNAFYFKRQGTELIPNAPFWADLPRLAKEGVLFTYNKMRQCIDNVRHK